jgi:hypothetical protein
LIVQGNTMDDYMKYVIVEYMGLEIPIVFSNLLNHEWTKTIGRPISAGFCRLVEFSGQFHAECFGKSVTLQLESRGAEDAEIIKINMTRHIY